MLRSARAPRRRSLRFIEQLGVRNVLIDARPTASRESSSRAAIVAGAERSRRADLEANIEGWKRFRRGAHSSGRVLPSPSRDLPELVRAEPSYSTDHSRRLEEGEFFDEGDDAASATVCVLGEGAKVTGWDTVRRWGSSSK